MKIGMAETSKTSALAVKVSVTYTLCHIQQTRRILNPKVKWAVVRELDSATHRIALSKKISFWLK